MKSQQINFFLSPEDSGQLADLAHSLGFAILKYETSKPEACVVPDLELPVSKKMFVPADQLHLLVFKPVRDYFTIDELESPVVSFWQNRLHDRKLNRGRFYFVKDIESGEMKNEAFLKKCQALFKQFKKTFPNAASEDFAPFWVSPKAAELHRQGYVLAM